MRNNFSLLQHAIEGLAVRLAQKLVSEKYINEISTVIDPTMNHARREAMIEQAIDFLLERVKQLQQRENMFSMQRKAWKVCSSTLISLFMPPAPLAKVNPAAVPRALLLPHGHGAAS